MIKCRSRITKTFKTTKADSCWPEVVVANGQMIPVPDHIAMPQCPGEVSISFKAVDEPYMGGSSAVLELKVECTHCKYPYFTGYQDISRATCTGEISLDVIRKIIEQNTGV